jgi:hypothetical protein
MMDIESYEIISLAQGEAMKKLFAILIILLSFDGIINAEIAENVAQSAKSKVVADPTINYVALAEFTKNMLQNNKAMQDAIVLAAREYLKANPMPEQQKIDAVKLITYTMDTFNEQKKYEGRPLSQAEEHELEMLRANAQSMLEPFATAFLSSMGDFKAQQQIIPNFLMTLGKALYEALSPFKYHQAPNKYHQAPNK